MQKQIAFSFAAGVPKSRSVQFKDIEAEIAAFRDFGQGTRRIVTKAVTFEGEAVEVPTFVNEFWTAGQRQAHSLHEISYRACFKPQLPGFFIERLTTSGGRVYDPFSGRGTTVLEAALQGRRPVANDVNPLSELLARPRLDAPSLSEIRGRLDGIGLSGSEPETEERDLEDRKSVV